MVNEDDCNTGNEGPHDSEVRSGPDRSPDQVQLVFVGMLVFIVLSVVVEYIQGDSIGLNAGEDFGLVLGTAIIFGACVGMVAGALHDWGSCAKRR